MARTPDAGAGVIAGTGAPAAGMSSSSSEAVDEEEKAISASLYTFASIFAAGYLLLETIFKLFATATYMADNTKSGNAWKRVVFGIYTLAGAVAVVLFAIRVQPFTSSEDKKSSGNGGMDVEEIKRDDRVIQAIYSDHKLQLLLRTRSASASAPAWSTPSSWHRSYRPTLGTDMSAF